MAQQTPANRDGPLAPRLIDVFSGAGGMSLGFSSWFGHSFEHVWANDFNSAAAETLSRNFGIRCARADIHTILESDRLPKAQVVMGGPPCQGFSLLNKKRKDDPRKALWRPFVAVVERSGAEIRSEPPPLNLHFGRPTEKSVLRYKAIPQEGMNRFDLQRRAPELTPACWIRKKTDGTDLFGRLWWDRPAFTIRTEFFKPEKGRYLYPNQHRPITHREAARFQTFPDDFRFAGSKIEIARQIGNAVPPLLAARIADCVVDLRRSYQNSPTADPSNGPSSGEMAQHVTAG